MESHNIVIIGAGPAGLATAIALAQAGMKDVVVLERETVAGGIPRHCGHRGFGAYKDFGLMKGPDLANQLRAQASHIDVRTSTTVVEFTLRGNLRLHSNIGVSEIAAEKIVLATGARESATATRLIGGRKFKSVMNTGELQQRVYLNGEKPFKRPVVLGSEWVSYSSLLTLRHIGVKPVAMIAEPSAHAAPEYFTLGARLLGTKVLRKTQVLRVLGDKDVEAIEILRGGEIETIACDGLIISGQLRSEHALYSAGLLERVNFAPKVTERFQTSKPNIFAVGNVLGHVATAGACMAQGRDLAKFLLK